MTSKDSKEFLDLRLLSLRRLDLNLFSKDESNWKFPPDFSTIG